MKLFQVEGYSDSQADPVMVTEAYADDLQETLNTFSQYVDRVEHHLIN